MSRSKWIDDANRIDMDVCTSQSLPRPWQKYHRCLFGHWPFFEAFRCESSPPRRLRRLDRGIKIIIARTSAPVPGSL